MKIITYGKYIRVFDHEEINHTATNGIVIKSGGIEYYGDTLWLSNGVTSCSDIDKVIEALEEVTTVERLRFVDHIPINGMIQDAYLHRCDIKNADVRNCYLANCDIQRSTIIDSRFLKETTIKLSVVNRCNGSFYLAERCEIRRSTFIRGHQVLYCRVERTTIEQSEYFHLNSLYIATVENCGSLKGELPDGVKDSLLVDTSTKTKDELWDLLIHRAKNYLPVKGIVKALKGGERHGSYTGDKGTVHIIKGDGITVKLSWGNRYPTLDKELQESLKNADVGTIAKKLYEVFECA